MPVISKPMAYEGKGKTCTSLGSPKPVPSQGVSNVPGTGKLGTDFLEAEVSGEGSVGGPSLSLIGPLLHDKPQDINCFFEKTSGPHLGKLGLEQQRPC